MNNLRRALSLGLCLSGSLCADTIGESPQPTLAERSEALHSRLGQFQGMPKDEKLLAWETLIDQFAMEVITETNDPDFVWLAHEFIEFYERVDRPADQVHWLELIASSPSASRLQQLNALADLRLKLYPSTNVGWPDNLGLNRSLDEMMGWFDHFDTVYEAAQQEGTPWIEGYETYYDNSLSYRANLLDKHIDHMNNQGDPDYRALIKLGKRALDLHELQVLAWEQKPTPNSDRAIKKRARDGLAAAESKAMYARLHYRSGRPSAGDRLLPDAIAGLESWLDEHPGDEWRTRAKRQLMYMLGETTLTNTELVDRIEPYLREFEESIYHLEPIRKWFEVSRFYDDIPTRERLNSLRIDCWESYTSMEKLEKAILYHPILYRSADDNIRLGDFEAAWNRFDQLLALSRDWPASKLVTLSLLFNKITRMEAAAQPVPANVATAASDQTLATTAAHHGQIVQPDDGKRSGSIEQLNAAVEQRASASHQSSTPESREGELMNLNADQPGQPWGLFTIPVGLLAIGWVAMTLRRTPAN